MASKGRLRKSASAPEIVVDWRAEDMCVSKARLVVPLAGAVLRVGGERERQIYQLLAKDNASKDFANRLELSLYRVETHCWRFKEKLV
jgi:ATP/maltotriose-dependent transcriptional regulator MalT